MKTNQENQAAYIAKLEATKPKKEDYETEEEFEEAYGYWMSHQGRIIALYRSKGSLEK